MTYNSCGKQVLREGKDFAQAIDPEAARTIVDALNLYDEINHNEPVMPELIAPPACQAYQASDQMLCRCGLAWDVNDPEPPQCPRER